MLKNHLPARLVFNWWYLLLALLLLLTEIIIAMFINDRFIRPYFGDFLVVILLYCFIRAFFDTTVIPTVAAVLIFAVIIELTQYFQLINYLGLQHSTLVRTLLGGSFDWKDVIAYVCGAGCILFAERNMV